MLHKLPQYLCFAALSHCAAAQVPPGALTIGEMKADPEFAKIEPADPGVTRRDLFSLREQTEERLRRNLPAIIGTLIRFETNPAKIPPDLSFRYEKERNLRLACWQADGAGGRAFALLDVLGELRIHIVRDSKAPLPVAGEASLDGARKLLVLLWGGAPTGEPRHVLRSCWEWHGPDGITDDDRTTVDVSLDEDWSSQEGLTKTISIKTGAPFEQWKKLTVDHLGGGSAWLTTRKAIAAAIQQLDAGKVADQPKPPPGTTFRSLSHSSIGWLFELELPGDVARRFVTIGIADKNGRKWTSSSSNQTSILPPMIDRIAVDDVRHWPEYRAAVVKQREDERVFRAACDDVRPKIAAAIATIRPDLKDRAQHLRFSQEAWRNNAGVANYVKSSEERVPLFTFSFGYEGSRSRLTTALMVIPADGREPSMKDHQAWQEFGTKGIERIFGIAAGAECEALGGFHLAPPPSDPRNSQMTLDLIEMRWAAQAGATRVIVPGFFRVERYVNGNYYFYWNSYSSAAEVDAALKPVRAGLSTSNERAAMIAAKSATLRYPDLSLDDWYVSKNEFLLEPFRGGAAEPRPGASRSSTLISTWRVVLRKFPQGGRYIEATVDATTGDLLDLQGKTTPVE